MGVTMKPAWETFAGINDSTGFANGDKFQDEEEVHRYFSVWSMKEMFNNDINLTQPELDEMAEVVIENKWHCEF